jgi:hypothetical protein
MKRILIRASIVAPTRLSLDVNWYDTDTLEQGGLPLTYDDTGVGTGDDLYAAINQYVADEIGGQPENIMWI